MEVKKIMKKFDMISILKKMILIKKGNEVGLYYGQPPILKYICDNPGCSQIEISEFYNITPASIALSTKRMEKSGLLTKEIDPDSLRSKKLCLTDKGNSLLKSFHDSLHNFDEDVFKGFKEEEINILNEYINRILYNITSEDPDKIDFHNILKEIRIIEKEDK